MRLKRNWRHLALILHVDLDAIRRLEQYSDISPTIRLFYFILFNGFVQVQVQVHNNRT